MPIFVSFALYIFGIFIPRLKSATHSICVKLLHTCKHDKLTQCCHAITLALARLSCNMCNKLYSVYWAFYIWVNYITVRTLHLCITRFECKISELIDSESGIRPPLQKWESETPPLPPKIMPLALGAKSAIQDCLVHCACRSAIRIATDAEHSEVRKYPVSRRGFRREGKLTTLQVIQVFYTVCSFTVWCRPTIGLVESTFCSMHVFLPALSDFHLSTLSRKTKGPFTVHTMCVCVVLLYVVQQIHNKSNQWSLSLKSNTLTTIDLMPFTLCT